MKNPRETRKCSARLRAGRGDGTAHARDVCGAAALDFGDVRVAGQLVEIPLCQEHFRKLRDCADPSALTLSWATDAATV
jgi:hypothetical protein